MASGENETVRITCRVIIKREQAILVSVILSNGRKVEAWLPRSTIRQHSEDYVVVEKWKAVQVGIASGD